MDTVINPNVAMPGPINQAMFILAGKRYLVLEVGSSSAAATDTIPESDQEVSEEPSAESPSKKLYVYGLAGLAKLLNCSKSTAYNIKRSHKIDAAVSQFGKTIVVDAEKALELLRDNDKSEKNG